MQWRPMQQVTTVGARAQRSRRSLLLPLLPSASRWRSRSLLLPRMPPLLR